MSVIVDRKNLSAEDLGLRTVGELLTHVQKTNRLVVRVLIDGQEPDRRRIGALRKSPLNGHTVFVETAEPKKMAIDVLDAVNGELALAERQQGEAADLLGQKMFAAALEKLSGCFNTWQHAEESVVKTAQLLRIDLAKIAVEGSTLRDLFGGFTRQLRKIKSALDARDFAAMGKILADHPHECAAQWRLAIDTLRQTILSL